MAWLTGWSYRKKITIDNTKVDAALTDFPVLVKLTSTNFDFAKANADGFDIRFTESDGTTLLKYERERHDQANSLAEYWVKVPSVSSSANTEFYIYYRAEDTVDGADPTNVWDSNFKGVYHKKDITTSTINDSTVNVHHGTKKAANEPIEADGKIGKAQHYDGTDDYINLGNDFAFTGSMTLSVWVKFDTLPTGTSVGRFLYKYKADQTVGYGIQYYADKGNTKIELIYTAGNNWMILHASAASIATGTWYLFTFVHDIVAGADYIYIDGVSQTVAYRAGSYTATHTPGTAPLIFASFEGEGAVPRFDGLMDEGRVSDTGRSAAWIKASYNSGNNSLVSYGSEETPPPARKRSFPLIFH